MKCVIQYRMQDADRKKKGRGTKVARIVRGEKTDGCWLVVDYPICGCLTEECGIR